MSDESESNEGGTVVSKIQKCNVLRVGQTERWYNVCTAKISSAVNFLLNLKIQWLIFRCFFFTGYLT